MVSGVDLLRKSFVNLNTSVNTSFHSVLATWQTKDDKSSATDVTVFELDPKKQAGDGNSSSSRKQQEALTGASFSSDTFDSVYTLGAEVR
jgi:hypothetical protein